MAYHKKGYWGNLVYHLFLGSALLILEIYQSASIYLNITTILFLFSHVIFSSTKLAIPLNVRNIILFFMALFLFLQIFQIAYHLLSFMILATFLYLFIFFILIKKSFVGLYLWLLLLLEVTFILFLLKLNFYLIYVTSFICLFLSGIAMYFLNSNKMKATFINIITVFLICKCFIILQYGYLFIISKI